MAKRIYKSSLGKICLEIIKISTYLSLFTPLILSGKFFFPFVGPKSLYFMALSEIIFFSWLILILIEPRYRPNFNLVLLSLVIYLIIFSLASFFGVNLSYSFWSKFERMTGILMHLHLFAFFLVLSSVFDKEYFKKIFIISVCVALLASIYALANLKNPATRGGGTIGNESFLGTYLLFNLFFTLYLIFESEGFLKNFSLFSFFVLIFSICLIGVSLEKTSFLGKILAFLYKEGARAAKLCFFGGLVLLFYFWLIFSKKKILRILGIFLLSFSIIFSFYFVWSIFQPHGFGKKMIDKEFTGAFGGRFVVWQGAVKGFLERPWLGWGPENFEFSFIKYFHPCLFLPKCGGEIWFDRAHNIILDTLISTGILGLISYFLIFLFSFWVLWKNFLKNKINFWPTGIFSSLLIAYFIQNLTVFDMISSYLMFFLSLAFIAHFEKERVYQLEFRKPNSLILSFIVLSFLISFFFFIFRPLLTDANVIYAIQSPPFSEKRISFYQKSVFLSPMGKFQIRQFLAENTLTTIYSTTSTSEGLQKELDFVIEELRKNIKESPLDFRSYLRLGQLLNIYSQFNNQKVFEAEEILRKTIELSPNNPQGYWNLAQNMLFQGKFEEAIILTQKAVDLESEIENSHLILIQTLKIAGKLELAKKKAEEAIKINPNWEEDLRKIIEGGY